MIRLVLCVGLVLAVSGAAWAETAAERPLEESLAMSSLVVLGKITKAAGEVKEGETTYKKYDVAVEKAIRETAGAKVDMAALSILSTTEQKTDEEVVLFLGSKTANGHRLHGTAKADAADKVKSLIEFEAKAAKELDGADKLRAAFFFAHKLRPVLLAAGEKRGVKQGDAIPDADKDKLLSILSWALQESVKKEATADFKAMTDLLRRVLSGEGGLPEYATRQERMAQFLAVRLANEKLRAQHTLTKLALADEVKADGVIRPVAVQAVNARGQVMVIGPNGVVQPATPATPQPQKPVAPAGPKPESIGKPVGGLALSCRLDDEIYNFKERADLSPVLTATFRNVGSAPIRVNSYTVFPFLAEVCVIDPAGKVSIHADRKRLETGELAAMGSWSFKELKPGETIELTERLPPTLFQRDGDYRLCVVYRNNYGPQFGLKNAWTGEVVSGEAVAKVIRFGADAPPTEAKPEPPPTAVDPSVQPPTQPVPLPVKRILPMPPVQIQGDGHVQIHVQAVGDAVQVRAVVEDKAEKEQPPVEKKQEEKK